MGKFFVDTKDLVRVSFPDGEWIDIKEELNQTDQDFILDSMAKAMTNGGEPKIEMRLGRLALLERSIVAWSFKDEEKPIPLTKENISNLRVCYRGEVLNKINELAEKATSYLSKNA